MEEVSFRVMYGMPGADFCAGHATTPALYVLGVEPGATSICVSVDGGLPRWIDAEDPESWGEMASRLLVRSNIRAYEKFLGWVRKTLPVRPCRNCSKGWYRRVPAPENRGNLPRRCEVCGDWEARPTPR